MKATLSIALSALLLAACSPRLAQEREAAGEARSCAYGGSEYRSGDSSCQGGYQFVCRKGVWDATNLPC